MTETGTTTGFVTLLRVTLRVLDRWAVGGVADATGEIDLPVLVDPRGGTRTAHVPGTSLAGSLRRHLGPLADEWLGPLPSGREGTTRNFLRERSPLAILGASTTGLAIQQRGVTKVNSRRRAAEAKSLRHEEWVEPGDVVILFQHETVRSQALVNALLSWRPTLGRGGTTGMGRAMTRRVDSVALDLTSPAHLTWWLTKRHTWYAAPGEAPAPEDAVAVAVDEDNAATPEWDRDHSLLELTWTITDPVHIGFTEPESPRPGAATVDKTLRHHDDVLVPGSSWKGVYRHRVEFILGAVGAPEGERTWLVDWLFGSLSGPGVLVFEDSVGGPGTVTNTHVAIDRFTGGAMDTALFQVEAAQRGMVLTQRIRSRVEHLDPAITNLLRHVARDLDDGLIGIGGDVTRGYGTVQHAGEETPEAVPIDVSALVAAVEDLRVSATAEEGIGS